MHGNLWITLFRTLQEKIFPEGWEYRLPPALFNLTLTASIIIVAVLLVRLLLRKAPRVYSYALWAVVAFRLICPISFSSDFSLLNALDAPVTESGSVEYVPVDIVHTVHPSVDLLIPEVNETINEQLPQGMEQTVTDPLEFPAALASWIWMLGAGVMLLWALISLFNLRQKLCTAVLLEGNVFQSEHVGSPFILGLFRPKIYIPFGLDEITLKYVLAHERYHLKRLDHIVKVFSFILLAVHWFNPLCWLAFHLMSKDMEMSCDEKVLSQDKNIKTEYSTILLSFASNRRFPSPSPLAFGETGAKSRIKNALKWKQPKVWVTVLAAVFCIAIITVCAANPTPKDSAGSDTPYEWTSTVDASDIKNIRIQPENTDVTYSLNLNSEPFLTEFTTILNNVPPESIYAGRGIPSQLSVTIVQQTQTIYMNYGGSVVEISLLGKYGGSVWEIHDDSLNALMERWLETALTYNDYALGKEKAEEININQTQVFHDLTEQGPITLTAGQLSSYRFRTNSTKILLDFERSDDPVVIRLHAAESESPILYFSTESSNFASCSFSNLTSAREYYLSVDCADDVQFTISDGGGSFRVYPLT